MKQGTHRGHLPFLSVKLMRKTAIKAIGIFCGCFAFMSVFGQLPVNAALFNDGWSFHRGDLTSSGRLVKNIDSLWQPVRLPHDWSINGPFSPKWASATGYLPEGTGWYRKTFRADLSQGQFVYYIYFEGVYKHSKVWLNGHLLGERPNGFASFYYNLTPYLHSRGENELLVKVDHSDFADCRWYTGSGIYRNVFLIKAPKVHIPVWGIRVSTAAVAQNRATVNVEVAVENLKHTQSGVVIENTLIDARGAAVARSQQRAVIAGTGHKRISASVRITGPELWSVDRPFLYTLVTTLTTQGKKASEFRTPVGIRQLRFSADSGLFLNGENIKLKGVCVHDDAGSFGTAAPMSIWKERLTLLKDAGCNAIRMTHNPHATALYSLCDQMGFLVIDEAFDEWELGKHKWISGWNAGKPGTDGYHSDFKQWWKKDLGDMILRDRNHPSVMMWSIGNEIDYPNDPYSDVVLNEGHYPQIYGSGYMRQHPAATALGRIARELSAFVRSVDATRPVTAALAAVMVSDKVGYTDALDIAGYNYQEYRYEQDHQAFPHRVIYGSENGHGYSAWQAVTRHPYIMGQFLWTGIDYLGEAGRWPDHGNEAGLIDLADYRKPEYYFRQSVWSDKPTIYVGTSRPYRRMNLKNGRHAMARPVWNYAAGDSVNVYCYTNCREATLLINGISAGTKKQNDSTHVILWRIAFERGRLEVKGKGDQGQEISDYLQSFERPDHLLANAYAMDRMPDENQIYGIDIQVADRNGHTVLSDTSMIQVDVSGGGRLIGLENGNVGDAQPYGGNRRKASQGHLKAYVEVLRPEQTMTLSVHSPEDDKSTLKPVLFEIKPGPEKK